jgi:SAM-dependent methyltransferase
VVADSLALAPRERVLDAGCGQGISALELAAKRDVRVVGITVVPFEALAAARRQRRLGERRVAFAVMDYARQGFGDASFDAAFTLETLCHASDLNAALAELFRVLRPGGRLALFEYSLAGDEELSPREREIVGRVAAGSAMHALLALRHGRLARHVESAGFVAVGARDLTANTAESLRRLGRLGALFYPPIRWLGLQERFPNLTTAAEFPALVRRGRIRYGLVTARRP